MQNGTRQQQTIGEALPAGDWTSATYQFEAPAGATNVFVSAPIKQNGTFSSRAYSLINISKPGAAHWQQPLVSITFDDGWQLSYDNATPVLQKYGYAATFYINPSAIETPNFMTAQELSNLSNAGNEIAAHGYDHDDLTTLDDNALDYQLHTGRDYLRRAGFTVTNAATPYGRSDAEVQWYARKYFDTLRGTETGVNTRQNLDPYNLKVLYINDVTSPQTVANALQQAKDSDGWLILVYHRVGDQSPSYKSLPVESSTTSTKDLQTQINMVHTSGIRVLPVSAAYAALEKQP
jgi:peptidoglycan/xylan/chitin deacetylase (PgdA/CDA1 family)